MPCGLGGIRGAPVLIVVVLLACEEATSGPAPVPVPPLPSSALSGDRAALGALYEATGGPNWTRRDNWMSEAPVDAWQGVVANPAGDVLRLTLANNNLSGRIPPELGNLVALEKLELSRNRLAGLIPPELGHLASLEELQLSGNNLTGSVPPEFGRLTRLQLLSVSHNPRLAGPLPVSLMVLDRLERIETAGTALIAHELGHNMSLLHAPCGNPDRIDPSYPHANGTIGDWRYDYWQSLGRANWLPSCSPGRAGPHCWTATRIDPWSSCGTRGPDRCVPS